jgi:ribosomal-protein-serine acetyltransferase
MNPIVVDQELQLRLLAIEHATALFALTERNRAYLREWLPWLDSVRVVSDTEGFIGKTVQLHQETKAFVAGIWHHNRLVGVIGHNRIDWDNRVTYVGYWLAAECQGKGMMTRCCRALIDHAFDTLDLNRIEICTATNEGIRRQGEWLYDRFIDLNVFALLRSTWALRGAMQGG